MSDLDALRHGTLDVVGRMPWSSNYTFLVQVDGTDVRGVYKPLQGEQPLSDFPPEIYKREIAAYELSRALGWPNIPTTIERDGPYGIGSLQLFVNADFEQHYFTLLEREDLHDALGDIAIFDIVANNTDRKAGHVLFADETIYAIDNGLCFNVEPKLRTVIWDFANSEIAPERVADLQRVQPQLGELLNQWLNSEEINAIDSRIDVLATNPTLPEPQHQWQFPWPLL